MVRWLLVVGLVLAVGCGRFGFDIDRRASVDGSESGDVAPLGPFAQRAYVKASNADTNDAFGTSIALSTDGSTLAVSALAEASSARGINGNQADNSVPAAGAVYVYRRASTSWTPEAYVKASNTDLTGDWFGYSVAISADGSTLAVGAPFERSAATGIGGNEADNSAVGAGAVYVFTRSGTTWTQQAYVKASNTGGGDFFGYSIALSSDGATLAVGALFEQSSATGVGGNQGDNSAAGSGAAYVFTRAGTTWTQQAYVKASNTGMGDYFGYRLTLSADGSTLAVASERESSAATGIGGNQADNSAMYAGAVYVYSRTGTTWTQQAYVKASNTQANDQFGDSVALSGDGATLAVGADFEDSAATGVDGNQGDNSAGIAGAVYVFTRTGATWSQQAYVKASNTDSGDFFGASVALSPDGSTLAVGAMNEGSNATGVDGDQADDSLGGAGAAYMFTRTGTSWTQHAYIKASNTGLDDKFGSSIALSAEGSLAVAAINEDSAGDEADNSAANAGAVYVFQ
jgi:hypothetical protein